jgi:hypothetical protein
LTEKAKMSKKRISFVDHLFTIVSDPENKELIRWREDGGFTVLNAMKFSKQVLPQYFKHDNYCSFVRQLSNYHFVTIAEGDSRAPDIDEHDADATVGPFSFRHEANLFQRDRRDLLAKIERRRAVKRSVEPRAREDGGDTANTDVRDEPFDAKETDNHHTASLVLELQAARELIAAQQAKIEALETERAQLRSELMASAAHVAAAANVCATLSGSATSIAASSANTPIASVPQPPPRVEPLADLGMFEEMTASGLIPKLEPLSSSTSGSSPLGFAALDNELQLGGLFGSAADQAVLTRGLNTSGLSAAPDPNWFTQEE